MEIGIGRFPYLGTYLLTGVFSSLAFGFIYPFNQGPLVGASGAIAGLMGAYLLIYSRKRSRVFCSLGFCSQHSAVFGWFLFPFWLSKEAYLFVHNTEPKATYVAHIGGLLAGIIIGFIFLEKRENKTTTVIEDEPESMASKASCSPLPTQGFDDPSSLSNTAALSIRKKIIQALEVEPNDPSSLIQLFHIDKRKPKSDRFHRTAGKLLQHLANLEHSPDIQVYFEEYKRLSGKPRLQPPVMLALATAYIRIRKTTPAARLLLLLLEKRPEYPGLPSCLFKLGCTFREQDKEGRAEKCFQLICKKYPQTIISQKAEEQLTPPYSIAVR